MSRDGGTTKTWFVKVDGRVYGPYTQAQMRGFIQEGRVAAHSLVSIERDGGWKPALEVEILRGWLDQARGAANDRSGGEGQASNFIIVADIRSETGSAFQSALSHFGDETKIVDGVWLLRTASSAARLRNELSHLLDRDDSLFIVDASRNKTAWFNLGDTIDQRIREVWNPGGTRSSDDT
ncbi:DUF4339 domain-containing protein [Hyphobacterium marinum]|uniref:DUF4339 domain-containing protein n=1 Tax=Hyphobacterium marinum TaxID=3116574 RepID=A0ABU7LZV4_9PROT|nr:DUF4339 domain-containing protein [Hyphobacterium sp. Y6023]MEE2567078.1 DUF4339 domain-containing protein [Hyphobacterium sp. Y6023]